MIDNEKKAAGLADTIKQYFKNTDFTPGMYGAAGGAGLMALSNIQARPGENSRQRALRILRNAAAGGVLGGVGAQVGFTGLGDMKDGVIPEAEGHKPGLASSIPARAVYVGATGTAGKWLQEKMRLHNLKRLMPREGFGPTTFALNPKEHTMAQAAGSSIRSAKMPVTQMTAPLPILAGDPLLNSANRKQMLWDTDKVLRDLRVSNPKSFGAFMAQLENNGLAQGKPLNPHALGFLESNYVRGTGNWRSVDRAFNFLGGGSGHLAGRIAGRVASPLALAAAALSPELINTATDQFPAGKATGNYLTAPVTGNGGSPSWISKAFEGKDYR